MAAIATFQVPQKNAGYLDAAELAAIIRKELRSAFPGVTFRVKTHKYAGGSSVDVQWTDGPLESDINAALARYRCEGFDGMTDSRTNSGPIRLDDGRLMNIHSFIFARRDTSPTLKARVSEWFDRHFTGGYGGDKPQAIWRASRKAKVVNGCLVIQKDWR